MKTSMLVVLCVALAMYGVAGRTMLNAGATGQNGASAKSDGAKTGAYAGGSVVATDGTITAKAVATAEALAVSQTAIAKSFAEAIHKVKEGVPATAAAEAVAEATATAIAQAFASAYISIQSTSSGNKACVVAKADAYAVALAAAKAFAKAVAVAVQGAGVNKAVAEIDATAIAAKTAEAFATAQAKGCIAGEGKVEAFQESLSVSIVTVYAKACAGALAKITADGIATAKTVGVATSDSKEKTTAKTDGFAAVFVKDGKAFGDSFGDAFAATSSLKVCSNYLKYKCCGAYAYKCPYKKILDGSLVNKGGHSVCSCY